MAGIESKLFKLMSSSPGPRGDIAAPSLLAVTVIYIVAVLSVPLMQPQRLVWLAAYPIVAAEMSGLGYVKVFVRSLWIIPLLGLVAMFNPIIDRQEAFSVHGFVVTTGWLSFTSIIIRGMLSLQAVLIITGTCGFNGLVDALRSLGCPAVMTAQMSLTYRYLTVIVGEAVVMKRARAARGYGHDRYPMMMWGRFVGQLLVRSVQRATRIHRAMLARGFNGTIPTGQPMGWNTKAWLWLVVWTVVIAALRFIDFSKLIISITQ